MDTMHHLILCALEGSIVCVSVSLASRPSFCSFVLHLIAVLTETDSDLLM